MKVFARAVTRVRGIDIYFFDVTRYAVTRVADRRSEVLRWGRKFILCQSPGKLAFVAFGLNEERKT